MNAVAFLLVFVYFVGRRYYGSRLEMAADERSTEISLAREGAYV
jgi:hypothetical protein